MKDMNAYEAASRMYELLRAVDHCLVRGLNMIAILGSTLDEERVLERMSDESQEQPYFYFWPSDEAANHQQYRLTQALIVVDCPGDPNAGGYAWTPNQLLVEMQDRAIYFIHPIFEGAAGVINLKPWLRTQDEVLIEDHRRQMVQHQDPLDWLTGSADHIHVYSLSSTGDFHTSKLTDTRPAMSYRKAVPYIAREELDMPSVNTWIGELATWLPWYPRRWFGPPRVGLVHLGVRNRLVEFLTARSQTTFSYKQTAAHCIQLLERERHYAQLVAAFPDHFLTLPQDTVDSAFTMFAGRRAANADALREAHAKSFSDHNMALTMIDKPKQSHHLKWLALLIGLVVLWRVKRWVRGDGITTAWKIWWGQTRRLWTLLRASGEARAREMMRHLSSTMDKVRLPRVQEVKAAAHAVAETAHVQEAVSRVSSWTTSSDVFRRLRTFDWAAHWGLEAIVKTYFHAFLEEHMKQVRIDTRYGEVPLGQCVVYGADLFGLAQHVGPAYAIAMWTSSAMFMHLYAYWLSRHRSVLKGTAVHGTYNLLVPLYNHVRGVKVLASGCAFWWLEPVLTIIAHLCSRASGFSTEWAEFVEAYHTQPWEHRPQEAPTDKGVVAFLPEQGIVPKQVYPFYPPVEVCQELPYRNTIVLTEESTTTCIYHIIVPNYPLYSPASSDHNRTAVVMARILADPPSTADAQEDAWRPLLHMPLDSVTRSPPLDFYKERIKWLAHIDDPAKKRRIQRAMADLDDNPQRVGRGILKSTQLQVKTDEVLLSPGRMKPRAIANVGPHAQALLGPEVYGTSRRLKKDWSVIPTRYETGKGWSRIWISWGSTSTDMSLTLWMQEVLHSQSNNVYVLVAGDDSLVATNHEGLITFYESDVSMIDQSLSRGPLQFEYRIMRRKGASREVVNQLYKLAHSTYKMHGRRGGTISVDRSERPTRDTGGADTTQGNSSVMIGAWIHHFRIHEPDTTSEAIVETMRTLGLKLKIRTTTNPELCSFLKGKWYRTHVGLVWGPLPSRVLKMGKTLQNPCVSYRTRDYPTACLKHMEAVADSYRPFMRVPLVRVLVERFARGHDVPLDAWKVQAEGSYSGLAVEDLESAAEWYGVDPGQIEELEQLLATAPLFSMVKHPLWARLAARDYG